MQKNYLEFCLKIPAASLEVISEKLFEFGALGIEELESNEPEQAWIKAYFSTETQGLEQAISGLGEGVVLHSKQSKPILNWQENWKEHFKPLPLGNRLLVRPPWETAQPTKVEIVINPGLGFGTGYHESTRLALEALEELAQAAPLGKVMDVGAGSGILSVAALKLGGSGAQCCELEAEALAEIPQNMVLSGLNPERAQCLLGGPEGFSEPCDTLLANITGDALLELAGEFERLCQGRLLLSGIVDEYIEPLRQRLQARFQPLGHWQIPPWHALAFQKKL